MLARLGVVLGIDSAEFQKGISDANRKLDQISAQMPKFAAVAGAAFAAATYKAIQYADAVSDTAKANDLAIESVLALGDALQKNGGQADMAGRLLSSFTAKVDEAAEGSLGAQQAFAKIGITLNDIAKLNSQDLLDKTIQGLANIQDPIKRNALAMEMFGKAAKGVDWREMANGSKETREQFKQYAESIAQAADLTDKLEAKTRQFTLAFTQAALPALNEMFDALAKNEGVMNMFMGGIRVATETIAILIKYTSTVVVALVEDIKFLGRTISNVFSGNFKEIEKDYKAHQQKMQEMIADDKAFAERILSGEIYKQKDLTKPEFAGRDVKEAKDPEAEKAKKLAESLEKARGITNEFEKQQKLNLEQASLRAQLNGLANKEREVAEAVLKVREQTSNQLSQIDLKIIDATIAGENEMVEVLKKVREEVELSGRNFEEATARQVERIQETQNTFQFGWNQAFRQFAEDSRNYAVIGSTVFNTLVGTMNSALEQFVRTGKVSFKSLILSMIQDLIILQTRMLAMQAVSRMFGASGILGNISTALTYGTNIGSQQTSMLAAQGFANGGMPPVGVPSLVGERGPELFIPQQAGTIIPNNRLSNMLGNTTNVTNNYIDAIDAKSFEERILSSHNAVWSANMYANKSLPVSRGRA